MSTCISRAGEFSAHDTTEGNYICVRCGVLDEDGIYTELYALRATVARVEALADEWRGKRDKAMCSDENDLRFYAYVMSKRIVELGTALSGPEGANDE